MMLRWTRDARGPVAFCGSQGQGIVRLLQHADGWSWTLDMLPGTDEPLIRAGQAFASEAAARRQAEEQVDTWPTPIAGAIRA